MRTVIARIFDYSLDGIVAEEGSSFFDFCRDLPDDPMQIVHERDFFANADVHIMGRKHYQDAAQHFPEAVDHPYAEVMNAARKVIFSQTMQTIDWANSSIASGDLGAEMEKLKQDGDGSIVAHGGFGALRGHSSATTSLMSTASRSSLTWQARACGFSATWDKHSGSS
jgi:dihydrofolate reductase